MNSTSEDKQSSNEQSSKYQLANFSRKELEELLSEEFSQKTFRARQIFKWAYQALAQAGKLSDFSDMTDISLEFREVLSNSFELPQLEIESYQESRRNN